MRKPFLSALSVLAVAAAIACGESLTEPAEPTTQPPAISANRSPPASSGVVDRFPLGGFPPPAYDPETNLEALFGVDIAAFCSDGGPGVVSLGDYADQEALGSLVHAPGQGGLITIRGKGSLYIWVGTVPFAQLCTRQPLGAGWAKTVYTENATSPQDAGPNAADTFHFKAQGPVTTADGIKHALVKVKGLVKNGELKGIDFTVRVSN